MAWQRRTYGRHESFIVGKENANRQLKRLENVFGFQGEHLLGTTYEGAVMIQRRAQANIKREVTGNLRRGVVAKKFDPGVKDQPASFVGIDYRISPHAHLIEFGHLARDGSHVAAQPFFFDAVESSQAEYVKKVEGEARKRALEMMAK